MNIRELKISNIRYPGFLKPFLFILVSIILYGQPAFSQTSTDPWGWGSSSSGQLGLPDNGDSYGYAPLQIENITGYNVSNPALGNIKKIACGLYNTIVLLNDGSVKVFGSNSYGQLGIENGGKSIFEPTAILSLGNDVVDIAAGSFHTLFAMKDGTVRGCGDNASGQLGTDQDKTIWAPRKIEGVSNVHKVYAGRNYSMAIDYDGTVWAWGYHRDGELGVGKLFNDPEDPAYLVPAAPQKIPGLEGVVKIAIGGGISQIDSWYNTANFTLFLVETDEAPEGEKEYAIKGCGSNLSRQLGISPTDKYYDVIDLPCANPKDIAAGIHHSLFLMSDGTVMVAGINYFGALGLGELDDFNEYYTTQPEQIPDLESVSAVYASHHYSVAVLDDGTLKTWGSVPYYRRQGIIYTPMSIPEPENIESIGTGAFHALAVIKATEELAAYFTADPASGMAPLTVVFTDRSYGQIQGWAWDFENDGIVDSIEQNPVFTYSNEGVYTVSLTVTGADGAQDTRTDIITAGVLSVDFMADREIIPPGLPVLFQGESNLPAERWEWDFDNDGTIDSIEQNPSHIFSDEGVYSVSLAVTATSGSVETRTRENLIRVENLKVISSHPAKDDWAVSVHSEIMVTFNMGVENVNSNTLAVGYYENNIQNTVTGTILSSSVDDKEFIFTPSSALPFEKEINIKITGGANGVKVKGLDAFLPDEGMSISFFTFPNVEIRVIQAVEGAEYSMVALKPTMVRVFVGPFHSPENMVMTKVRLLLDGVELETRSVNLKESYTEYELAAAKKGGMNSVNFFIPQSRNFSTEGYHYVKAIIDPDKEIFPLAGASNSKEQAVYVRVPQKVFNVEYVALNVGDWDDWYTPWDTLDQNEVASYYETAKACSDFLRAVYPVSYQSYDGHINGMQYNPGISITQWIFLKLHRKAAASKDIDRIVGIYPKNWMKDAGASKGLGWNGVIIKEGANNYPAAAHEIMHTFGNYVKPNEDYMLFPQFGRLSDDGWWVDKGWDGARVNIDVDPAGWKDNGTWPPSERYFTYMGSAGSGGQFWTRKEDYEYLYDRLVMFPHIFFSRETRSPQGANQEQMILISGIIKNDGSMEVDPVISGDLLDPEGQEPENAQHLIVFYLNETPLKTYSFDIIDFSEEDEISAGFAFTVAMPENANRMQIMSSDNTVLWTGERSSNAPAVDIEYPNSGELLTGDNEIQWSASDPDNDTLSFTLYFTDDRGAHWRLLDMDIEGTSYQWNSSGFSGSQDCMLKIVATDGFNTAEDITDLPFSLSKKEPFVSILEPRNGSIFGLHQEIRFEGMLHDPQGNPFNNEDIIWTSDLDGDMGTGLPLSCMTLSLGTHNITLKASNADGLAGTSTPVQIIIQSNWPPNVQVYAPSRAETGSYVNFECFAEDGDGTITLYEWDFDGDGNFDWSSTSTGNTLYKYFTTGEYNSVCRVKDDTGETSESSTQVLIYTPRGISGRVTLDGSGFPGVKVTLGITSAATTVTDSEGNFIFTGLPGGEYSITPTFTNYAFDFSNREIFLSGSDITGMDFAARQLTIHTLSVTANGNGTVIGMGIYCGNDCTHNYEEGSVVTLAASAVTGYLFTGWEGACSGTGLCEIVMDASKNIIANFAPDPNAPTAAIVINQGATTSISNEVMVMLSCTDNAGIIGYYLSEQVDAPPLSSFISVGLTTELHIEVPFTLSSDEGTKTIHAWFRNGEGYISLATATDMIIYIKPTGPTEVCGDVYDGAGGPWTLAGSPYIVTCNLNIPQEETLTIDPGVEIRFDGEYGLDVFGALIAKGTAESNILFSSNSGTPARGDWKAIYFGPGGGTSVMDHCALEYGGSDTSWGWANICVDGISTVSITNTISRYSYDAGLHVKGDSSPVVTQCEFYNNRYDAMAVQINSYPVLSNLSAHDNDRWNGIMVEGGNITTGGTWYAAGIPYVIAESGSSSGNRDIASGVTLTIEPGTTIKMEDNGTISFTVYGALNSAGTAERPIIFTSLADDNYMGDTNGDGTETIAKAEDWESIEFSPDSAGSIVTHTMFRYGGEDDFTIGIFTSDILFEKNTVSWSGADGIKIEDASPLITLIKVHDSRYDGFWLVNSSAHITECESSNNGTSGIGMTSRSTPEIVNCILTGNGDAGVSAQNESNPVITGSSLSSNANYGVTNKTVGITINAKGNWWGDATGPGGAGPGLGDHVSNNVLFDSWRLVDIGVDLAGDLDDSGRVNMADLVIALQISAGISPYIISPAADVNNDHRIDMVEIIHILQEISGL